MACFGRCRNRRNCENAIDDIAMRIVSNTNVSNATNGGCNCCCCCNCGCNNTGGVEDSCDACGPCYYVTNYDCDCSGVEDTSTNGCTCASNACGCRN